MTSMIALAGTYQNGVIRLDQEYPSDKPLKVIVTFLEEAGPTRKEKLSLDDFSFAESRKALEGYAGSFSDTVVEERRHEL